MKKTLLAAMLIAVTALFLSCSNGSSGSGSSSGIKFKPKLFDETTCTEAVTGSSFSLSAGKWKKTDYWDYSSSTNPREYYYYYEYEVGDSGAVCTKYKKYEKYTYPEDQISALKKASKEEVKSTMGWDDYSISGKTVTGVKEYDETETANKSKPANRFYTYGDDALTNADNTKYYITYSETDHEYYEKQ